MLTDSCSRARHGCGPLGGGVLRNWRLAFTAVGEWCCGNACGVPHGFCGRVRGLGTRIGPWPARPCPVPPVPLSLVPIPPFATAKARMGLHRQWVLRTSPVYSSHTRALGRASPRCGGHGCQRLHGAHGATKDVPAVADGGHGEGNDVRGPHWAPHAHDGEGGERRGGIIKSY